MAKKKPKDRNQRKKTEAARLKRKKPASNLPRPLADAPSQQIGMARRLGSEGRYDDAMDLCRDQIRQQPKHLEAHTYLAQLLGQKFQFDRLEEQLRRLVACAPRTPVVHHASGQIYDQLQMPARAIDCYEHAVCLPGVKEESRVQLASLYERAHRLDEAAELIERSLRAEANDPQAQLVQGRIHRRRKKDDAAESVFQDLIRSTPDSEWACQAWSELALMRDRQGDYPGAAIAIGQCKELQRQHEGPHWKYAQRLHGRLEQQIDQITSAHFTRCSNGETSDKRVGLLTGFPRSGTTLLEQVLDTHPDLVSSEERGFVSGELLYRFCAKQGAKEIVEVLDDLKPEAITTQRTAYFQSMEYLLGEPIGGRFHLDKNPGYALYLPLMLRLLPQLRLIVALRDPRDVVLSCYLRYLPFNPTSVCFLTPERTAERYALEMRMWLKLREILKTPWCEIRYEDAVMDLPGQARRALDTLGLDWDPQVLGYRERLTADKQVNSPSYEAVAEPVHQRAVGRWENYQELLEPTFGLLAPFVREFGYLH